MGYGWATDGLRMGYFWAIFGLQTKMAHRSEPLLSWNPTYLLVAEARFELWVMSPSNLTCRLFGLKRGSALGSQPKYHRIASEEVTFLHTVLAWTSTLHAQLSVRQYLSIHNRRQLSTICRNVGLRPLFWKRDFSSRGCPVAKSQAYGT